MLSQKTSMPDGAIVMQTGGECLPSLAWLCFVCHWSITLAGEGGNRRSRTLSPGSLCFSKTPRRQGQRVRTENLGSTLQSSDAALACVKWVVWESIRIPEVAGPAFKQTSICIFIYRYVCTRSCILLWNVKSLSPRSNCLQFLILLLIWKDSDFLKDNWREITWFLRLTNLTK